MQSGCLMRENMQKYWCAPFFWPSVVNIAHCVHHCEKDTLCCWERYIAPMTCNINKVVMCFLLSAFGLCFFVPLSWSWKKYPGTGCPQAITVINSLEKLHEAITPTVSCVQWNISDSLFCCSGFFSLVGKKCCVLSFSLHVCKLSTVHVILWACIFLYFSQENKAK